MTKRKLSQAAVGRALGIGRSRITALKKQGMPVDSVEAAKAWRAQHCNFYMKATGTGRGIASQEPEHDADEGFTAGVLFELACIFTKRSGEIARYAPLLAQMLDLMPDEISERRTRYSDQVPDDVLDAVFALLPGS